MKRKKLRIVSALGPGDVVQVYRDWKIGRNIATETSVTYSSQEFDFYNRNSIPFWAISSHARKEMVSEGENKIENRPHNTRQPTSGIAFLWMRLCYALSLFRSARQFKASHILIDSGTTHWFFLSIFFIFGIEVIPNFHNVYWVAGRRPNRQIHRVILFLDKIFFRHCVRAALGVSPECGRQISELSTGRTAYFDYRVRFFADDFLKIPRPQAPTATVRVVFVGRIERAKGVFDLLEICKILACRRPGILFHFEVCGSGSALGELEAEIIAAGFSRHFTVSGRLARQDLLKAYGRSHIVVVPTRFDFAEGMPMVCAEASLAGRPVIMSAVTNAHELIGGSSIEARAEDPEDFATKIEYLVDNPAIYANLVIECAQSASHFLRPELWLGAKLEEVFRIRG